MMKKNTLLFFLMLSIGCNALTAQQLVTRKNNQFIVNNQPYYFVGMNMWYASLIAMPDDKGGNRERLVKELDFLKQSGVTNIRVLVGAQGQGKSVYGINPVHPAAELQPGKYNDDVLLGMDYLLQQLQQRNMNAVFFLTNNWEWSGGFLQYLNWHGMISDSTLATKFSWDEYRDIVSTFYSCRACINDYHNFVAHVLSRTNSITGKKYIDEPGIMAWEIANEPRPMRPEAITLYTQFIKGSAAFIKSIDPNHLVTAGTEGFIGTENKNVFEDIHDNEFIDYLTIHIWPKNWSWYKDSSFAKDFPQVIQKTKTYISENLAIADKLDRPLVIEEFGLPRDGFSFSPASSTSFRDRYVKVIGGMVLQNKKTSGAVAGMNIWAMGGFGKPAGQSPFWKEGDDLLGDPPMEEQGLNAVFATDSTWKWLRQFAAKIK
ncbi:MAG: cellulase family glycosylhydrolase [Bacteroidetes bacterium]|nr:cellulase family glycosylhydrolase [Bacteroidota bacterium]